MRTSVVRKRSDARVIVEQEAVSRMLLFSKRVHLVLEIIVEANALPSTIDAAEASRCLAAVGASGRPRTAPS